MKTHFRCDYTSYAAQKHDMKFTSVLLIHASTYGFCLTVYFSQVIPG